MSLRLVRLAESCLLCHPCSLTFHEPAAAVTALLAPGAKDRAETPGLGRPWSLAVLDCLGHQRISLNLISFLTPTHVFQSDASEHDIVGFCAISGGVWSLEIPANCQVGCQEGIRLMSF
jgi:hypothetical protein